ncbi:lysylphosphatidylglycerol synthase domain-containing protein [Methylobacterium sp. J-026]|uniref:lysylphosphatidylglycerol synthase domain-containing protein n=1 Tax=Methylobacterium sp. J-026 TaxID=2836624 RepID=UPI001FBA8022|nr:lysylphosphatidylglycerol synthase domain-containing protein [Methylobacterium sp. J-026]MCJ2133686.1 lysylphosphatidylglycerol synthase domain-containing protein [Methylobacterium sp. J-026]
MTGTHLSGKRRVVRALVRRLPLLGTLIGLGFAVWLVATNDLDAVATAFGRIGVAGFVGVTLVRALVLVLCGIAWARILDGLSPAPVSACLILRFVREGINVLLPVASVGGEVVGARLLTFWGVAGSLAAASVLADLLFQVGTLALFAGLGAGLLRRVEGAQAAELADWTLRTLAVAAFAVAALFALQRTGIVRLVEDRVTALGRRFVREAEAGPEPTPRIQGALDAVWAAGRRGRLAQSCALHALAWLLGATEIAVVLTCIGIDNVGLTDILVIESLSQAIKAAAFLVPSGLGVQEGGLVLVCGLFGIPPGTAIALSLARRVPDVVLGLPALLVWQNLEARRHGVRPAAPTCDRP